MIYTSFSRNLSTYLHILLSWTRLLSTTPMLLSRWQHSSFCETENNSNIGACVDLLNENNLQVLWGTGYESCLRDFTSGFFETQMPREKQTNKPTSLGVYRILSTIYLAQIGSFMLGRNYSSSNKLKWNIKDNIF